MHYPPCKLCLERPADQKSSHIIPKFMCKGLFEETKPRHALSVTRDGKSRKIQDIFKEDYILCNHCEKRIGILETHFARIIEEIHSYANFPREIHS